MRFIDIEYAQVGMVLARPLRGRKGEILLTAGTPLRSTFINTIKRLRYSGLYIKDEYSEGIEVEDIISEDLRHQAVIAVGRIENEIRSASATAEAKIAGHVNSFASLIDDIIERVLSDENTIVNLIDIKIFDRYTYQHSVNVCVLSVVIGVALGLDRAQLFNLSIAAILHDLGKFFVDKEILAKPGRLTFDEFAIVKKHPELAYDYIKSNCQYCSSIMVGILQHHERFNGTGYPHGRKGTDIHLFARIIALADVYDAITSMRPYHDPILPSEAYEYILGNAGEHFDPEIVEIFTKKIAPFPEGVEVLLSNGLRGIVFKNHPDMLSRPIVKLLPIDGQSPTIKFIDLRDDSSSYNVTITKVFMK